MGTGRNQLWGGFFRLWIVFTRLVAMSEGPNLRFSTFSVALMVCLITSFSTPTQAQESNLGWEDKYPVYDPAQAQGTNRKTLWEAGDLIAGETAYERGDYKTALDQFYIAADKNNGWTSSAQYDIGTMYYHGKGVPQDYAEAMTWYRKAASQRLALAQNALGLMYMKGESVPQDYAEAMKWFLEAAEQGDPYAQINLATLYANGLGMKQDYVRAYMWANLAASRIPITKKEKHDKVANARDAIAAKLTPSQIAEAQKLARDWQPK